MRDKRLFRWFIQLLILLLAIGLLHHFWHANPPPPPPVGGGDNDEDDVKYTPTVPVSVAPITVATLHGYVMAYGTVEAAPARTAEPAASASIRVPASSLVAEVNCIEGQHVEKGQILFKLDGRAVSAEIDRAGRQLAAANDNLIRFKQATDVPQQYLLNAQHDRDLAQAALDSADAQEAMLSFAAPLPGTVVQLNIRPGELADPSTTAVQIVDLTRLVIALNFPAWQLRNIKPGEDAEIVRKTTDATTAGAATAPATGPAGSMGKVAFIDPQVDPNTGMGSVDISVPPEIQPRLGQFLSVRIVSQEHQDCLTVPVISLVRDAADNWGVSLAVREFTRAFRHPVKVGLIEGDRAEVEGEGLKAGEFVVTTGAQALPEQSRIEVSK
jgi:membrane fusion protein (multidrug efflux system)